jgi:hypothetical protein
MTSHREVLSLRERDLTVPEEVTQLHFLESQIEMVVKRPTRERTRRQRHGDHGSRKIL